MKTSEINDKFRELVNATKRGVTAFRTPPDKVAAGSTPDPAALLAFELSEWASRQEADKALRWVRERISGANLTAHSLVGTPNGAYWLGVEAGLRLFEAEMLKWRGEPIGIPPVGPLHGGSKNAG